MGDNDQSQLENKAKVKIMTTTAFIGGGGGISLIAEKFSTQSFFCFVLFCFFSPTIPLSLNE